MFETFRPLPLRPKRTWLTLSVSAIAHSTALVAIVGISLIAARREQPAPEHIAAFMVPPGMPALPSGSPQPAMATATPQPMKTITPAVEPRPSAASVQVTGVTSDNAMDMIRGTAVSALSVPPGPVRIGGGIAAPALLRKVEPIYPAFARSARLQGSVVLEAHVSSAGVIESVDVIRSVAPLDAAAIAAVKQWRYTPFLQNGEARPFIVTVTVAFSLVK